MLVHFDKDIVVALDKKSYEPEQDNITQSNSVNKTHLLGTLPNRFVPEKLISKQYKII